MGKLRFLRKLLDVKPTYWWCDECGHEVHSRKGQYNFQCPHCQRWMRHSDKSFVESK